MRWVVAWPTTEALHKIIIQWGHPNISAYLAIPYHPFLDSRQLFVLVAGFFLSVDLVDR